jgi:hypothetical protein
MVLPHRKAIGTTTMTVVRVEQKRFNEAGMSCLQQSIFPPTLNVSFAHREGSENVNQSNLHVSGLAPKIDHEELIRFFGTIGPVSLDPFALQV